MSPTRLEIASAVEAIRLALAELENGDEFVVRAALEVAEKLLTEGGGE